MAASAAAYPDGDRLVVILRSSLALPDQPQIAALSRDLAQWQRESRSVEHLAGAFWRSYLIAGQREPVWLGIPLGLVLSAIAASLLVGTVPTEQQLTSDIYWVVVPVIVAVTSLAAGIPARHAARINPTVALRYE